MYAKKYKINSSCSYSPIFYCHYRERFVDWVSWFFFCFFEFGRFTKGIYPSILPLKQWFLPLPLLFLLPSCVVIPHFTLICNWGYSGFALLWRCTYCMYFNQRESYLFLPLPPLFLLPFCVVIPISLWFVTEATVVLLYSEGAHCM